MTVALSPDPGGQSAPAPKVGIVLVNWRDGLPTVRCVEALHRQAYPNWTCYLVDNESTAESQRQLAQLSSARVELIPSQANLGWAGGCNLGARYALRDGCEQIWFLNNDAIAEASALTVLVDALRRCRQPTAAVAAVPAAISESTPFFVHSHSLRTGLPDSAVAYAPDLADETGVVPADFVSGFAMLVPAVIWRLVGEFDERLFLYYEDVDWGTRATRAGLRSAYVPGARVAHDGGASTGGPTRPLQRYFGVRNRLKLSARYSSTMSQRLRVYREAYWALDDAALSDGHRRLSWRALGGPRARAVVLALRDFVLGRDGDCPPIVRSLHARTTGTGP